MLESLVMAAGHRGCCHDGSNETEPMAASLSSSAFSLALCRFTHLITGRIHSTCLETYVYYHTHAFPHTLSGQTPHRETRCVFQCVSLVLSSIMHDFERMKGCFGFRHASHIERETSLLAVIIVHPQSERFVTRFFCLELFVRLEVG